MIIELPYPHKALWPNGRSHWAIKARETKKHRQWAALGARACNPPVVGDGPIQIKIICHPKATGPAPDCDNITAACKAYLDGIADAMGVNDRNFAAPTVEISPNRTGRFVIRVGVATGGDVV
jgi:crossover junction endodeoxyribonuclease RusA